MSAKVEKSRIAMAAFCGSVIGAAIFATLFVLQFSFASPGTLVVLPFALFIGILIAMLTVWPLGWLISCVALRFGPMNLANAAFVGMITGTVFAIAACSFGFFESYGDISRLLLFIGGFALLGAISGSVRYRLVLSRNSNV